MNIDDVLRESRERRKLDRYTEAIKLLTDALRETADARLFYSRGITFDLMDQREKAVEDLTSAIQLDDTNAKYYFERGSILSYPLGRDEEAIRDFERALQLDPAHVEAHRQCAGCLLIMGRPNRALEHAEAALRLAPGEAETHYFLGEAYISLNRFEEAVASLKRAVELDPTQEQYASALSRALEKRGAAEREDQRGNPTQEE
jgi:tetratricopeptide (TPR) repeat protein